MDITVKTGCTIFYEEKLYEQTHYGKNVVLNKRSRFTPSLVKIQLVWILVKVVPFILAA